MSGHRAITMPGPALGVLAPFALVALSAACGGIPRFEPRTAPAHLATLPPETTARVLTAAAEEVDRQRIPAMLLRVELPDGRFVSAAVGTRDAARTQPAALGDCVRVGSLTKTFFAVVAQRLAERGAWSLEAPVGRSLPALPGAATITPALLLSHHAGVPDVLDAFGTVLTATASPFRVYHRDELVGVVSHVPRTNAPGERYRYSNGNYVVLGALLERVTERPVRKLLREHVLAPMDLSHTWLLPDGDAPACLLTGYDRDLVPFPFEVRPDDTSFASLAWTSGGIASTPDDVAAVLRGIRDATLVSPASRARMLPQRPTSGEDGITHVGEGLFRFVLDGRRYVGHAGLFIGSQSLAVWDEADGTIYVVLGNRSAFDAGHVIGRFAALLRR